MFSFFRRTDQASITHYEQRPPRDGVAMPANLQRARDLFLHAVGKLPPEQWDDYVAEACGGDTELRRQVGHLLQVHLEAGSFLESPAVRPVGTGAYSPEEAERLALEEK